MELVPPSEKKPPNRIDMSANYIVCLFVFSWKKACWSLPFSSIFLYISGVPVGYFDDDDDDDDDDDVNLMIENVTQVRPMGQVRVGNVIY